MQVGGRNKGSEMKPKERSKATAPNTTPSLHKFRSVIVFEAALHCLKGANAPYIKI